MKTIEVFMSQEATSLQQKIARLISQKGWNQEDFARISRLNRHTVRKIVLGKEFKLRNSTLESCARAFGLTPDQLTHSPLELLLSKLDTNQTPVQQQRYRRLLEGITREELKHWMEKHPDRARMLDSAAIDEILSFQKNPSFNQGNLETLILRLERKGRILEKVRHLNHPRHLEVLEHLLDTMHAAKNTGQTS